MDTKRRTLMHERNEALSVRDFARYQLLTVQIAHLPMKGIKPLTQRVMDAYARKAAK